MWGAFHYKQMAAPEQTVEDEPCEHGMSSEEQFAFEYWTGEADFGVLEALALIREGLSPSLHREFVKHHGCSPRQALKILL